MRTTNVRDRLALLLAVAALVGACGGGGSGAGGGDAAAGGSPAGDAPVVGGSPAGDDPVVVGGGDPAPAPPALPTGPGELKASVPLDRILATDIARAQRETATAVPALAPVYDVACHRLEYLTTDVDGRVVRASGLVAVPVKAAGARSPVLAWQHGTVFRDAQAPGNHAVPSEPAVVLAALGYVVVAADYVGYGASRGTPHPYLRAAPSAAAVVDFLTAARTWRRLNGVADNDQLFLAGYSEGGYVTMAAHRALQAGGSAHLQSLRATVAGAGPYDLQATLDGLLRLVREEQPALGVLLDPGLLRLLSPSVRRAVRDELLKHLLPEDADVVFDTRFIDDFLADDRQALAQHGSVHDWSPAVPVRLFHGQDDRTVPYASALSTLEAMRSRGAGDRVGLQDCSAVPSTHLGCVPEFLAFMVSTLAAQARDL